VTILRRKRPRKPRWLIEFQRDLKVFNYLFPWRVMLILLAGLVVTTYLFWAAYWRWEGQPISPTKALFAVINMTFFQLTFADMPTDERLDLFPVLVPLVGLPLFSFFGIKVISVIRVFFVRGERGQEWQEALIQSAVNNHILICGLGRIGYRVAKTLMLDYGQSVAGINDVPSALVDELLALGLPVILGNTEQEEVLQKAGVERARVVVVCTDKDWVNLETVVRIRKLNPRARVVLRMFEDELEEELKTNFKVDAIISRSAVAALSFTYAALGGKVIETFELADKNYVLTQIPLLPSSPMVGRTIGDVAEERDVTVVCHNCGPILTVEPAPDTHLTVGDNLFVFAPVDQMIELVDYGAGQPAQPHHRKCPILVCGLGHTGYRITTNLLALGCQVVALDSEVGQLSSRLQELGVPVKVGDLRWSSFLIEAGIQEAAAIVSCTEDDMINLQTALRARQLNPSIRIVMRIFDDQLSEQLRHAFGLSAAYSTSALATPDFVSAALNRMNVRTVDIESVPQVIVRLEVTLSALYGMALDELQQEADLTVLMHTRQEQVNIPPKPGTRLRVGDEIIVLVTEDKLSDLNRRNKPSHELMTEGYG
jgi:Trk K+ transport system NAD-binding subunit